MTDSMPADAAISPAVTPPLIGDVEPSTLLHKESCGLLIPPGYRMMERGPAVSVAGIEFRPGGDQGLDGVPVSVGGRGHEGRGPVVEGHVGVGSELEQDLRQSAVLISVRCESKHKW